MDFHTYPRQTNVLFLYTKSNVDFLNWRHMYFTMTQPADFP